MTTTTFRPASPKQEAFIDRLVAEKDVEVETLEGLAIDRAEGLSSRSASSWIDYLMRQPRKASAATITEDGMYMTPDGAIFKVQKARTSGNLYAKALVRGGEETDGEGWAFEYAPGAMRNLTPAMKMSLEQAKEFGVATGTCCVCGRLLTDPASVDRGIGPVCAGKF